MFFFRFMSVHIYHILYLSINASLSICSRLSFWLSSYLSTYQSILIIFHQSIYHLQYVHGYHFDFLHINLKFTSFKVCIKRYLWTVKFITDKKFIWAYIHEVCKGLLKNILTVSFQKMFLNYHIICEVIVFDDILTLVGLSNAIFL